MSRRDFFEEQKKKKMVAKSAIAIGLAIIFSVTIFVMYSQKANKSIEKEMIATEEKPINIVANDELTKEASFSDDKTVKNTTNSIKVELNSTNTTSEINNNVQNISKKPESKEPVSAVIKEESKEKNVVSNNIVENTTGRQNTVNNETVELSFKAPVDGEIIKDFAMDTLIYSKTLDEWCTHPGIDIKADKSTVVSAAEAGIVESIKNDPRYGLTIVISHANGFKTIYSNLLTTEFVTEGEEVEKGQTIATVGDTASFEIADETHLHFEMYKDLLPVNPTIYFK